MRSQLLLYYLHSTALRKIIGHNFKSVKKSLCSLEEVIYNKSVYNSDVFETESEYTCVFSSCGARLSSAREHTEHLLREHQLRVLSHRQHPPRRGRPPKVSSALIMCKLRYIMNREFSCPYPILSGISAMFFLPFISIF